MNEQINQMVQVMTTMMVLSMGMGMVRPIMLQAMGSQGRPKTTLERAATHFNVSVSEVKPWMIDEVEKVERGAGLARGMVRPIMLQKAQGESFNLEAQRKRIRELKLYPDRYEVMPIIERDIEVCRSYGYLGGVKTKYRDKMTGMIQYFCLP